MSAKRIPIKKIQNIFQLCQQGKILFRASANKLNISRRTLKKYVADIRSFIIQYPERKDDLNFFLSSLHKSAENTYGTFDSQNIFPGTYEAIANKRSTRKNEWSNYKVCYPNGYGYSRFCELFGKWCNKKKLDIIPPKSLSISVNEEDRQIFMKWKRSNNKRKWLQGSIFLDILNGISLNQISKKLAKSRRQIKKWLHSYEALGIKGLERQPRKANETIISNKETKKGNLMKLIHETPKLHGINRTSWSLKCLKEVYFRKYGIYIGTSSVSEYIRAEGFAFKKAKRVLTSPDPLYREKLENIKAILSNLAHNEKFFSVDEYGPFAIKIQGGRSFIKDDEINTYPQWQKSKGSIICTAALELSSNNVTHFYSDKKNTTEMIRLLEVLINKYKSEKRIFFSWDAASWHASKQLYEKIKQINNKKFRRQNGTPHVELAPLPSSAQFLNVIESVFSGMAKAIIHNSNYQSVNECKSSIDLYFKERNEYFFKNPKKAGNKIWGKELSLPVFDEAKIFKDPKWMR